MTLYKIMQLTILMFGSRGINNMEVYKRNWWSLLKSIVIALVTPIFMYFIVGIFTSEELIIYGISGSIGIVLLLSAVLSENIKFEIKDGHLLYYVRNKLREDYDLKNCYVGCRVKSETDGVFSSHEMTLSIMRIDDNNENNIDCTPLGIKKFNNLYDSISNYCLKPDNKLKTKKKEVKK